MEILFQILKVVAASLAALLLGGSAAVLWGWPIALAMTVTVGLVALLAPSTANCPRLDDLTRRLGIGVVIGVFLQSLAWAYLFDSQQSSDFGVYYRCGLALKATLADNLSSCQSAYISYGDLYWRRSLLTTVPIGWLGGGYSDLKIFNAILQGFAGLVIWSTAKRWLGPVAALVAIVVFAAYPDRSFALTLATSDHAATLLTSAGLACLAGFAVDGNRARFAATVAAGALIVALALTRSTGIFLLGAAALVIALQTLPRNGLGTSALCVIALMTSIAGGQALASVALSSADTADGFLRLASSLDISPDGNFSKSSAWIHHFWPAIPLEYRTKMSLIRLVQEVLSDGASYPSYLVSKAQTLTSGLGYAWFAGADLSANRDTVRTVAAAYVPAGFSGDSLRFWSIPTLALVLAGSLRVRKTDLGIAALGFFGVATGVMLFVGEVQARYLLVLVPASAFLAGAAFAPLDAPSMSSRLRDLANGAGALGALLIIGVCGWIIMRSLTTGPLLKPIQYGTDLCPTRADQVVVDDERLVMRLEPGEICAEAIFVLTRGGDELSFFASDGQFPYRFERPSATNIRYRVAVDHASIDGVANPGEVGWKKLRLPKVGQIRISVSVHRPIELAGTSAKHVFAYPAVWQLD